MCGYTIKDRPGQAYICVSLELSYWEGPLFTPTSKDFASKTIALMPLSKIYLFYIKVGRIQEVVFGLRTQPS